MSLQQRRPRGKIRPPRRTSTHDNFPESWERLSQAIREIHRMNAAQLSFEELYRTAYNMVLNKQGERLHAGIREVLTHYLDEVAKEKVVVSADASDAAAPSNSAPGGGGDVGGVARGTGFLKVLNQAWSQHTTCLFMIRDILMYMDLYYAKPCNVPQVYDLGLDLFRDRVVQLPLVKKHLIYTLLKQIRLERAGEVIDRGVLKSVTDMLLQLGDGTGKTVYRTDFEDEFLKRSEEFYRVEGQRLVDSCDASEYMKRVENRLEEEDDRVQHYLHGSTRPKLRMIVERELVSSHLRTIIDMETSGIVSMITNDKYGDLSRMYKLFSRVPNGLLEMKRAMSAHIESLGKAINDTLLNAEDVVAIVPSRAPCSASASFSKASAPPSAQTAGVANSAAIRWVQDVLELKAKFDNVLEAALQKDKGFQTSFNGAFQSFVNACQKSPEFISLFIDEILRKGLKGKTEEETEQVLDKTVAIFRFVQEKDVFERYYKQHLAKRLLHGRSVSDDAEKQMIGKLKIECGFQFTSKLEGMFNDMRTSADTMEEFKKQQARSAGEVALQVDISVQVLTAAFWPPANPSSGIMPPEVVSSSEAFTRFYMHRHSGRKLTWQMNMGNADLRATFPSRKHELNVSTCQMVILLLFNNVDTLAYKQIQEETEIPDADLRRNLQSLACAKYKVLVKEPKGREVAETDTFSFNSAFHSPLARIKIQTVASRPETEAESRDTRDRVDEARKHMVEAAIVRVMKARRVMDHNNLIAEVTRQLQARFQPNPAMIKKRIEALIEREYLERNPMNRKHYNYLA